MITEWGKNALSTYRQTPIEEAPGEHRVVLCDPNPKLYGIHDGKRVQAREAQFTLHYTLSIEFSPISFRRYMDVGKSKQVTQAAVCTLVISKDEVADMVLQRHRSEREK
jgi:hypothetical protein